MISPFAWDSLKNKALKAERKISLEEVIEHIAAGDLLDVVEHPNQEKYRGQRILIIKMHAYAWLVPFVEAEGKVFSKRSSPAGKQPESIWEVG